MKIKRLSWFLVALTLLALCPGFAAISMEASAEDVNLDRISGTNRYETAVAISQSGWLTAQTVVLARGDSYADALTGVPLAYALDAPMLLTSKDRLSEATKAEILRLNATKVYILGGISAVSDAVETELAGMGLEIIRLSGANRYATAALVARELAKISLPQKIVLAYALDFPDALAAASYAAELGYPILLVRRDVLPPETETMIGELGIEDFIVVGGTKVISETLVSSLPSAHRISGANRYETAVALAKYFHPSSERIYLATGLNFADAITGGALAAKTGNGMLLVQRYKIPETVKDYIDSSSCSEIIAFGGTGAVGDSVLQKAAGLELRGNTAGNTSNWGEVAFFEGWVYYTDRNYGGVYRMRSDGSNKQKIADVWVQNLNIVDGWVYYTILNSSGLNRMKTDGSAKTKVTSRHVFSVNIVDGWIYYTAQNSIERMRCDGTGTELLLEYPGGKFPTEFRHLTVTGGYMYYEVTEYINLAELHRGERMNLTTRQTEILREDWSDMIVDGDWVYYTYFDFCPEIPVGIYRFSLNGENLQHFFGDTYYTSITYMNVADGWIYFEMSERDESYHGSVSCLYRIDTDGTNLMKLSNVDGLSSYASIGKIYIADGWIYFYIVLTDIPDSYKTPYRLVRMRCDGGETELLYSWPDK